MQLLKHSANWWKETTEEKCRRQSMLSDVVKRECSGHTTTAMMTRKVQILELKLDNPSSGHAIGTWKSDAHSNSGATTTPVAQYHSGLQLCTKCIPMTAAAKMLQ